MAIVLSGAVSAATINNDTCADPIINGTVTINEYGNTRPLPNATVTVNSTGSNSRVLATTTTDANGYYSVNFYSTSTQFLVTSSYMGCNSVTQTVNVTPSSNPQDPNYYGTSNFQLTPKTATLINTGNGRNVYVAKSGTYNNFAGVINVRIDGTSYQSYCIDLFTPISINDVLLVNGPLPGTDGKLPSTVEWAKVNYIIHNYTPSNTTEAAAIQCAIWYFTSAHYGPWPGTDPAHPGYYQFMTHPDDAKTSGGGTTIRTRAFQIINEANAMNYPTSVILEPEITRVANGTPVTITATVRDQNGNPLSNVTVNFSTNRGSLSVTTGTTNAQGQLSTVLSDVGSNRTATVTAWVEGKYGALLYDDKNNPKQNLVCMNLLPYNLADTSQVNFDETANVEINQTVNNSVVNVGDQVNFTISLRNNGPSTATGIMIQDIIPEGLDNITVIPSVGTFFNNLWVIPSLANGATATLNIIGTVTASMAGLTVTNTATRTGQDQYNSLPGVASASVYTKMAMIDIDQTVNTPVNVGDIVTYIVSVTNSGPDTATNIVIEDHPPTNLANLTVTPSTGTFVNGIWTIPSLANGATATLTISGNATTVMAGTLTPNTATIINQTEYDPHTIGESTTKESYTKEANVALSQSANYQGNIVTFTVNATNNGPDTATNININDTIPANLTNVTVTTSLGTYENGVWIIPSLENGVVATLTIVGTAIPESLITNNSKRIGQTEYNSEMEYSSFTLYLPSVNLSVTTYPWKSGVYTYNYKQQIVMLVQVNNLGETLATGIQAKYVVGNAFKVVSYNLIQPGTLFFDEENNTFYWTIDSLEGGQNMSRGSYAAFSVLLESLRTGSGGSDFSVTSSIEDCDQYNIGTTKYRTRNLTINPSAEIEVKQTVSDSKPSPGDYVTITVKVKNNGPNVATGVLINDFLPPELTVDSDPYTGFTISQGNYNLSTGLWSVGTLENDDEATLTIVARVTGSSGTTFTNRAYKTGIPEQYDWKTENDSSDVIFNVNNTDVNLSVTTYPWKSGVYTYNYKQQIVMLVQVNNLGETLATGIQAKYVVGNAFKVVSYNLIQPGTLFFDEENNTFYWTIDSLEGGQNMSRGSYAAFSVLLESLRTGSGGSDFSVTSSIEDCDQYNIGTTKYRTRNLTINPSAEIEVKQTVSDSKPSPGDYVTITVKVKNNGPNVATGVLINDFLPPELTVDSDPYTGFTISQGNYNLSTGLWSVGTLENDDEATLTIVARVTGSSGTTFTNRAYKTGIPEQYDWKSGNDSDQIRIIIKKQ